LQLHNYYIIEKKQLYYRKFTSSLLLSAAYLKDKEKINNSSIPFFFKWIDDCLSDLGKVSCPDID